MDSSLPARAQSTFESNSNLLNYKDLKFTSSSRDGWSTTRVRAANAEALTWREAAQREQDEEAAAWANVPFEPEPGATTKDIRVYTKLGDGQYKYWGVQDLDETMEEFWARVDPDNMREYEEYGVTYPAIVTPASTNGTSESSACSIEIRDPETDKQVQDISHSSTEERPVETNLFGTMWPDNSQTISSVNRNISAFSTIKPVARGRPRKK